MGNLQAFSDMVGWSEGTTRIPGSDRGYNVLVGSTPARPLLFNSYATHPDTYNARFNSSAAGKHQIIFPTWRGLCRRLSVTDFSPVTQEAMFQSLVAIDCRALDEIESGRLVDALILCAKEWASLPASTAHQHKNTIDSLIPVYVAAGGTITA